MAMTTCPNCGEPISEKYCKFYSGKEPEFVEGDVFRIIVPLDENYSYDYGSDGRSVNATLDNENATLGCDFEAKKHKSATLDNKNATLECDFENDEELEIIQLIKEDPSITQSDLQKKTGISLGTIKRIIPKLQKRGILAREGGKRFGKWIVKNEKE